MGLFGKRKEVQKKEEPQLKVLSFPMSNGFRGFKKIHLTVHGIAKYPQEPLETKGQTVVLKQYVYNLHDIGWKVYLNTTHIGSIFREGAEVFNNDMVDAVYIKYDIEIVNDIKHWRPHMFVHYKE